MQELSYAYSFANLRLQPDLLKNLATLGYEKMTPIQAESLPPILSGRDVIAQGKTGSGKTAAFGLGLLQKLDVQQFHVQGLIVCPTRELAEQVANELRRLARALRNIKVLTLCGGLPFGPQITSLVHGAHVVVGTPGRLEDHLRKHRLDLSQVNVLVLDEADRMLDMGFQVVLNKIIDQIPTQRQTLLFSATFADKVQSTAQRIMQNPLVLKVDSGHDSSSIEQRFYLVADNAQRMLALRLLLHENSPESSLVFCNTKRETQDVANILSNFGFSALALHGDMEQRDRDQTLIRFSNKSASVLVATDVAARGLDIVALDAVFNFRLAHERDAHVHRIGRTGRAGCKGRAYTLFSENERYKLAMLDSPASLVDGDLPLIEVLERCVPKARYTTLQVGAGRKQKIRVGDILGALTGENGIAGDYVGKINVSDNWSYVAVETGMAKAALKKLASGKLKGRSVRVRLISL